MAAVSDGHRSFVVLRVGAIGGAHFNKPRAALAQHVGNSKAATNLDRLTSGNDNFLTGSERLQHHKQRGSVVVDGNTVLCSGRAGESVHGRVRAGFRGPPHRGRTRDSMPPRRPPSPLTLFRLSGARPRFVCRMTPEALITRRSEGECSLPSSVLTSPARVSAVMSRTVRRSLRPGALAITSLAVAVTSSAGSSRTSERSKDCIDGRQVSACIFGHRLGVYPRAVIDAPNRRIDSSHIAMGPYLIDHG